MTEEKRQYLKTFFEAQSDNAALENKKHKDYQRFIATYFAEKDKEGLKKQKERTAKESCSEIALVRGENSALLPKRRRSEEKLARDQEVVHQEHGVVIKIKQKKAIQGAPPRALYLHVKKL